jgi:methylisocitrate lyase
MSDSSSDPAVHPLVAAGRLLVVPGVYDVLSAKIAARTGFPAVVLTGYGLSAAQLGEPDIGLLTQTEVLDTARRICAAVEVGVIVDGDTGHGGPLNVQRMVRELVAMGARGVLLEDQRWPKRCGHMRGKEVVSAEEHAQKIRAAVDAESGATVLFVEGPRSVEELRRIGGELPPPLAVNLIEGGRTPLCSLEQLAEMGFFSVGFVLSGLYAAARALQETYAEIRRAGSATALGDRLMAFDEFNTLIGVEERFAEDERYRV